MSDAPPVLEIKKETVLITFSLGFNKINYTFSIIDVDDDVIRIKAIEEKNEIKQYQTELKISELKMKYKYYKMFDSNKECKSDLVTSCQTKNIVIFDANEKELMLIVDLKINKNNLMPINLTKIDIKREDKEIYLLKELKNRDKIIDELNKEIKEIKDDLKVKDLKIVELENKINNIMNRLDKLEIEKEKNEIKTDKYILDQSLDNVIKNSNIIQDLKEIVFLFDAISINKKVSFKLVYSSEKERENKEKLKNAYIGKNDIIIIIKTKKNRRFGGYAHESFLDKEFQKKDLNAFLFNLDDLKICKSLGSPHTIWNYNLDSIDFGWGTDLRIFHNFLSNKNYTSQSEIDFQYDKNKNYVLNGEKYFDVLFLELYEVHFD